MSSELEKTAKDKNPKQSAKSIMETTKPNLSKIILINVKIIQN